MLCGYKVSVVERTGLVNLTLSYATSYLFLAMDFVRPFGALKPYARNSPIHTLSCVASLP